FDWFSSRFALGYGLIIPRLIDYLRRSTFTMCVLPHFCVRRIWSAGVTFVWISICNRLSGNLVVRTSKNTLRWCTHLSAMTPMTNATSLIDRIVLKIPTRIEVHKLIAGKHASRVSMCGADYEAPPIHDNLIQRRMTTSHTHNCIQYRLPSHRIVTARPVSMCDADYEASSIHGNLI
ncbi:hypothetical protein CLF_101663, partial [Clonorchis sinensis]